MLYKFFCTTFLLIKIKSFVFSLVLNFSTSGIRVGRSMARIELVVRDWFFSALRASDQVSCYVEVSLVHSSGL